MFRKNKNADACDTVDILEWEEIERQEGIDESVEYPAPAVEKIEYEEEPTGAVAEPAYYYDVLNDIGSDRILGAIELDNEAVELIHFPALRMALGVDRYAAEEQEHAEVMETASADNGYEISELVMRYAQLDDGEEEPEPIEALTDGQEELPFLFRIKPGRENVEQMSEDETEQVVTDEFSMETELELQREISGELFDYIDEIHMTAEEIMRTGGRDYERVAKDSMYDPYNFSFNNRYDDTEEVLSSTPEISMEPKYKLEE